MTRADRVRGRPQPAAVTEGIPLTLHRSVGAAVDLADVAEDLAGVSLVADAMARATQLAAKMFPCTAVDLVRVDTKGSLQVLASSDPGLSQLAEVVWKNWPHQPISAEPRPDLPLRRLRHSYLRQLRLSTGVAAELMVPLNTGSGDHGHLRFMSAEPLTGVAVRALIDAFAVHASLALDRAALTALVKNLQLALEGNRTIGAAVGVLMALDNLTYEQGLEQLTIASQHRNRKLRDIAADVLYTGEIATRSTLEGLRAPAAAVLTTVPMAVVLTTGT